MFDNVYFTISFVLFTISVVLSLLLYNFGERDLGEAGLWFNIILLIPAYMLFKATNKNKK